ncbi:MAG: hypothetical protein EBR99_07280, partial [Actinobacteria bacterium]|nr:hypothetical protein [Actinomycetota bacterium]
VDTVPARAKSRRALLRKLSTAGEGIDSGALRAQMPGAVAALKEMVLPRPKCWRNVPGLW